MTMKLWRGDAPEVAQVTTLTPLNVQVGNVFGVVINGKSISVTAVSATASSVATLLAAAIANSSIPEFRELTATANNGVVTLTADVPFVIASANGSARVAIDLVQSGRSGTNMVQTFQVPVSAAGTFTVVCGDQITSGLAIGASAAAVQSALEGLSTIGSGNVSVSRSSDANDYTYTCTFQGTLAKTAVATFIVRVTSTRPVVRTTQQGSHSGTVQNEIQTITFGDGWLFDGSTYGKTYTLTLGASTSPAIDGYSSVAAVQGNINGIVGEYGTNTVTVSGSVLTVEFKYVDGSANQSQLVASDLSASGTMVITMPVTVTTAGVTVANEKQLVTLVGTPSGGTFTLTFSGQTTSAIAYNASAATVETAFEALSSVGSGNGTITGDAGGPYTIEFTGSLASADQPMITADGSSLTGGSSDALTVSMTTEASGPNHWDDPLNWSPAGVPTTGDDVRIEQGNVDILYGLDQSSVTLDSLHVSASYSGKIGLTRRNDLDYWEYRPQELAIGATAILIGYGNGSAPPKINLNTGSVQTSLEVRASGSSSEAGVTAVSWRGTHVDNVVTILGGDFGTCPWADQAAVIDLLTHVAGYATIKHTAVGSVRGAGTDRTWYDSTVGGQAYEQGV